MKKLFSVRTMILAGSLLLQLSTLCFQAHGAAGDVDLSFDPGSGVNGPVSTIVVQPDGKVLIGGKFTTVRGLSRTNLARLNADGSGDASFDGGNAAATWFNLFALSLQADGKVLVGHDADISRFNSDGSLDTNFNASLNPVCSEEYGCYLFVQSIALQADGKVLVAGEFSTGAGTNALQRLARLNTDGSLDASFHPAGLNIWMSPVALQPDGRILVEGYSITNVCNANGCYDDYRYSFVRLNANGSPDGTFNAGAVLPWIQKITLQSDGKMLVVGGFTNGSLVRLNANGSLDGSFSPVMAGGIESVVAQSDGKVLIAGGFGSVNNSVRRGIARLNPSGSLDGGFNPGAEFTVFSYPIVQAVALQSDGRIVIGGNFTSDNATNHNYLDRFNSDGSLDSGFNPGRQPNRVYALAVQSDGKVLTGGPLTFINGTNRYGGARLNTDGSLDSTFIPTGFYPVVGDLGIPHDPESVYDYEGFTAFALQPDGKVLVVGVAYRSRCSDEFGCAPGYDFYFVTRHYADGSLDTSFARRTYGGYGMPEMVSALALQPDGKILLEGNFGTNQSGITRLNPDGTLDNTFIPAPGDYFNPVRAFQPDGKVLLGYSDRIERRNPGGSLDNTFGSGPGFTVVNGAVRSIALQSNGNILIGGDFTTVKGVARQYVARLYGDSVAPFLNITRSNASVIVSWPATDLNFQLQESTDLSLPNSWSLVAQPAVTNAGQISVTVPTSVGSRFFRLESQ